MVVSVAPPRRRSGRRPGPWAGTLAAAVAAVLLAAHPAVAADANAVTEVSLGDPIHNVAVNHAAFATLPDGRQVAYQSLSGRPARLSQVDLHTNEVLGSVDLAGADSVWGLVVAPDGAVYAAGASHGHLYRWRPGAAAAEDLGKPVASESVLYDLVVDEAGRVYGGSYPTGVLWRYDPATGQYRDYGQVRAGSYYSRSLEAVGGKVYVGLGTTGAFLFEVDAQTGAKREIVLPEAHRGASDVSNIDARLGKLFVRTSASALLVYDPGTGGWTDLGRSAGSQGNVSPAGPGDVVYFIDGAQKLVGYQVPTGRTTVTGHVVDWSSKGWGWADLGGSQFRGKTLVMADYIGRLWYYNPKTGAAKRTEPDVPAQPVGIQTIALGPDGRVYASGYQSGGFAYHDPSDGTMRQFQRGTVGQAEGMLTHGGKLYLGVYPGGSILSFDPAQPFDYGTNPKILGPLGAGQDRPFAWTAAAGRVVIGSVPNYGQRGGAVTLLDPATGQLTAYRNVVPDHSVTALATVGDLVIGGTSVYGGLGVPPTSTDAKLFLYDPATATKVWEGVPVPGDAAVTALAVAPNGHVFGVTAGKLFEFDPATRTVLRVEQVASFPWSPTQQVWRSGQLAFTAAGDLYAEVLGTLYRVDTTTMARTRLAGSVDQLLVTPQGGVYFTRDTTLLRLDQ